MTVTKRILSSFLAMMMLFTLMPASALSADEEVNGGVRDYVNRLYETVLGRGADAAGFDNWYQGLVSGDMEAAAVALGFFESPEYTGYDKSDEDYVADLYRTFFDREGDEAGVAGWLERLDAGVSRRNVLKGFVDSDEFTRLCASFGVVKGTVDASGTGESILDIHRFVCRLYTEALGREADEAGREAWKAQLSDGSSSGSDIAYGFIFSPEAQALTPDSESFVRMLYKALMGREADSEGLAAWISVLDGGESREKIFEGFVNSNEFSVICEQYGIVRGNYHVGRYIDPNKPMVAITFDDGPSTRTHEIVDCLEANNAAATFFVVGSNARYYPSLLNRMLEVGCEIGNHTYDHPYLTRISADAVRSQYDTTAEIIRNATGSNPTVMRPPYGAHNDTVDSLMPVPLILWSIDTRDWETRNTQSTINNVLSQVRDGDIILMHDIHTSTVDAALYLIPELTRRGYQLVTVSEMAQYRGGAAAGTAYHSFRP